ncbi:hypothetical protein ABG067_004330 [Albugo candida]
MTSVSRHMESYFNRGPGLKLLSTSANMLFQYHAVPYFSSHRYKIHEPDILIYIRIRCRYKEYSCEVESFVSAYFTRVAYETRRQKTLHFALHQQRDPFVALI